jgi:hypothetical protein
VPTEDEWRQVMRDDHGCDCECVRVWDYDRIIGAGADPGDPDVVVFNHTFECHYTRIRHASTN